MNEAYFSYFFIFFIALSFFTQAYLDIRQLNYLNNNKTFIPDYFKEKINFNNHIKSINYTTSKIRLRFLENIVKVIFLIVLTFGGFFSYLIEIIFLNVWLQNNQSTFIPQSFLLGATLTILLIFFINSLIEFPFTIYKQFVIEKEFGFNRMNIKIFFSDLIKQTMLGLLIGIPVISMVLLIISSRDNLGLLWWFILWGFFTVLSLTFVLIFPSVIAPLFNKFSPLEEGKLKSKLDSLLQKCDFSAKGLFLMDGSKRSSHGNAFFAGFGKGRRIVLFDTLVERLSEGEIEAVLAHELGHYKCGHVPTRLAMSLISSFIFFGLFGLLIDYESFYLGLGIHENVMSLISDTVFIDAAFFILFFFILQFITFPFQPFTSIISRKHEYEADQYASNKSDAKNLISALVKLYRDNASPVITDKLYSLFYDSHPTASLRIKALQQNLN